MAGKKSKKVTPSPSPTPSPGPAAGTVWGVPAQQVFQGLPGYPDGMPKTEAGLMRYLLDGGMPPEKYLELATSKDGVAAMQAFVNDPQSGFAQKATQPQDAPPAGEAEKKSRKSARPPTRRQMQNFTGGFVQGVAEGGTDIKRATVKTPWGEIEVRNRRPAPAGPAAASEASGSAVSAAAPQQGPPAPVTLPPLQQQIQSAVEDYAKRGKVAPPWTGAMQFLSRHSPTIVGGAATLGALGAAGAGFAAFRNYQDKKAQQNQPGQPMLPPPMSPEEREAINRLEDSLHRLPVSPAAPAAPADPSPPAGNPAGSPPPQQTTLLRRLMSSREYA